MSTGNRAVKPRGKTVERNVLRATLETIIEHRTTLITIEEVATRANVDRTTIYRRYPTREELVLAAVLAHANDNVPIPDSGHLASDLRELCGFVRDTVGSPIGRVLLIAARSGSDTNLNSMREAFWHERLGIASQIIQRAIDRGDCEPVKSTEELIEQLVAPIHFRIIELDREVDDEYLDALVTRLMPMLNVAKS
jgi:AcrR family transcriptional regulator